VPSEPVTPPSSVALLRHPSTPTILIVDDEPPILEMLRDALVEEGFAVITAPDGLTALTLLQQTTVALVLMDFMMPYLNGIELADQLHRDPRTATIPLVLMTAVAPSKVASQFAAVIAKPFALDTVVRLVRQLGLA
jgi:CheY-like chemotaxis protein